MRQHISHRQILVAGALTHHVGDDLPALLLQAQLGGGAFVAGIRGEGGLLGGMSVCHGIQYLAYPASIGVGFDALCQMESENFIFALCKG